MKQKFLLYYCMLFLVLISCTKSGISKSDIDNSYQIADLNNLHFANDSIRNYAFELVSAMIVYDHIAIEKPEIKYRLKKEKDTIIGIVIFQGKHQVSFNRNLINKPLIEISTKLNEDGVYDLNYKHSFNNHVFETISLGRNKIEHRKVGDKLTTYNIFDREGDFMEMGYYNNDDIDKDTSYIDRISILKTFLSDSVKNPIKRK